MNIDHTQLFKFLDNENICYDNMELNASYSSGWKEYFLKGEDKITIRINDELSQLKANANFSYFWKGHNFRVKRSEIIDSINYVSEALNCNMLEAEVELFEFGTIVEISKDYEIKDIIGNHNKASGRDMRQFYRQNNLTGKHFIDSTSLIKLYNASLNIKNKISEPTREIMKIEYGYNPSSKYVKAEMQYKNASRYFHDRLDLNKILEPVFMEECKQDLLNKYDMIQKTKDTKLPESKKDINSATIPTLILMEWAERYGLNAYQEIKEKIKSIPEEILSNDDKKARRSQIKKNMRKLESSGQSPYDLKPLLEANDIT